MTFPNMPVLRRVPIIDAAALLAGFRLDAAERHCYPGSAVYRWRHCIVEAVKSGELPGHIEDSEERPSAENEDAPRGWVLKDNLANWLRDQCIPDDEMPLELRTQPKARRSKPGANLRASEQQQDKPSHPRRERSLLTLVEGLALEAMDGKIPEKPYKAAGIIQGILERHELKINEDTIASIIKEIQAIREERETDRV